MSTKHTPGPWLIEELGTPATFVYALNPQGYNQFWAHVEGGYTGPMSRTTDAELEANACLIAAAPELLEALKNLSWYADTCELFLKETHPGKAEALRSRVTQAIAAIAKATGGEA